MDFLLVSADWMVIFFLDESASFLRLGKSLSRGMRVVRMVRLVKLRRIIADITDRIPSEILRTMLRVFRLLIFIVLLNHYIACCWFWLGTSVKDGEPSWTTVRGMEDYHIWYQYTTSLHWSLTQFTPASMEVVPTNEYERTYSVCVLMFALVTFSSFVSIITSSVTQLQHIHARKLHNQVLLRRYLSERSISTPLVLRVCHFVQYYQKQAGGMERTRTQEEKVEALKMLPPSMIAEIRWETFSPVLIAHPTFYMMGTTSERSLREVCSKTIFEVSLALAQELFAHCETVNQMLFVLEGTLTYAYPEPGDQSSQLLTEARIEKEQWACEAALWAQRFDIYSPFVAASCCDVCLVSAAEFRKVASLYPDAFVGLACYSERFVEHVNEMAAAPDGCRWKVALCNNYDVVNELAHLAFDSDIASRRSSMEAGGVAHGKASYQKAKSMGPGTWVGAALSALPRGSSKVGAGLGS